MCDQVKGLLAKLWKDEPIALPPGRHYFDEILTVRVSGSVEKQADQLVAPTASLPVIPIIALFWQKCGVTRDHALRMLREALTEAMAGGKDKDEEIKSYIQDCEETVQTIKEQLIAKLPKTKRSGKVIMKSLLAEVLPVTEEQEALVPAA